MKKYIYAVIITCIGTILLNLNTKLHNPPLPEAPVAVVEAPPAVPIPETVPEPIPTVEPIVDPPVELAPEPIPTPASNQGGRCGDNDYAHSIYMQESGCRIDAVNGIGACGIGQSLPCSKLESVCPDWRTNYDCQNQWFTAYAMQYGSWEEAYNFKYCTYTCYSTRTRTTVNKNGEPWW